MENKTHIIPNGPVLIIMVGPSGAGKSTFIKNRFDDRDVVSSDAIREWLTGNFARQDKNKEVFDEFYHRIKVRLNAGQRVVADATHLQDSDRKRTASIGIEMNVPVFYLVINRPVSAKLKTGGWRSKTYVRGKTLIEAHEQTFVSNEKKILAGDGNKDITVIDTRGGDTIHVVKALPRDPNDALWVLYNNDFDRIRVVGDIHGNMKGLQSIIDQAKSDGIYDSTFFVFLGDITDSGPNSWEVVDTINDMVSYGHAIMVRGNHDKKLHRYIEKTFVDGTDFTGSITNGMEITVDQLNDMIHLTAAKYQQKFLSLIEQSPDWIELGDWLFAHASVAPEMFGNSLFRSNKKSFLENTAIYGETDNTFDDRGYPNRTYNWIGKMPVGKNAVLGHQVLSVVAPVIRDTPKQGRVVFLDTGSSKDDAGFLSFWDMNITTDETTGDIYFLDSSEGFGRE